MIAYIKNSNLRDIEKEEVLQQIIDMLLQAQQEEKPAEMIVGNDYEAFCQSIIDEFEGSKSILYKVFSFIQRYFIWMLTLIGLFMIFNSVESGSINLQVSVNQLYFVNIISLILIPFTRKSRQKAIMMPLHPRLPFIKLNTHRHDIGLPLGLLIVMALSLRFLLESFFSQNVFNYSLLLETHLSYIVGMLIIIFVIETYKRIAD